jgi:tRNA pseudouridine38-40 synthase
VQEAVETAAKAVSGEDVTMVAAGRTDAGVHALAMRAHIDITKSLTPFRLGEALNAHLRPQPIAVTDCQIVDDDWHARFDCLARHYRYTIINRRAPLSWQKGLAWQVTKELDAQAMHDAAQLLVGLHDFTTFRSAHCQSQSPVKTLDRLDIVRDGDDIH